MAKRKQDAEVVQVEEQKKEEENKQPTQEDEEEGSPRVEYSYLSFLMLVCLSVAMLSRYLTNIDIE